MTKNKPICNQSCLHIFKTAIKWLDFRIPQKCIANLFKSVLCYLFTAKIETVYLLFEKYAYMIGCI